jgi:hypothetical protein
MNCEICPDSRWTMGRLFDWKSAFGSTQPNGLPSSATAETAGGRGRSVKIFKMAADTLINFLYHFSILSGSLGTMDPYA